MRGATLAMLVLVAVSSVVATAGASPAMFANTQLLGVMTGAEVVGGGDPDGRARLQLTVRSNTETKFVRVCWRVIAKSKLEESSMTYLRRGSAGTNGPAIFVLGRGQATGCSSRTMRARPFDDFVRRVTEAPQTLYVELHTTDFPGGAVRGQLRAVLR